MTRLDLPVSGMSCAACARTIEKSLTSTSGVDEARVNFATHTATVEFDAARTDRAKIVEAIRDVGYDVAEGPSPDDASLFRRFLLAAICAAIVMTFGILHRWQWVQLALTLPVMLYSARPFFQDAWKSLLHRSANMNTLIALGSGTAFLYSIVEVSRGLHDVYFEAAAAIVALILLGRLLESGAQSKAGESVRLLIGLKPQQARVERNGEELEIASAELRIGDVVIVRPGERIACDGVIASGASSIDESMLTGESLPIDKAVGDPVYRGAINRFGSLRITAQKVGADTALDRIIELVAKAQSSRAPVARLADTVSGYFTWIVLGIALLTAAVWLWFDPALALSNAVAVLIVACPCALGLATPVAIVAGTGRGAQRGILIKSGEALEAAAAIDTVLLDKTGTLTEGRPVVDCVLGENTDEVIRLAAAVEKDSEHPIAKAILERARALTIPTAAGFVSKAGFGVTAVVEGREINVARPSGPAPPELEGMTVAQVTVDAVVFGWIGVADAVREETPDALRTLTENGYRVRMLTGDRREAAARVAHSLGITDFTAELTPAGKESEIARLRAEGRRVAMVGDGVNDAPALAGANIGIAMGSGTDIAAAAGGITILRNDLRALPEALLLARKTMSIIRQNLFWAFAYNVIALPVAAGVLYPAYGWQLSPMIASGAMAFSSLSVVLNSLRLRRV